MKISTKSLACAVMTLFITQACGPANVTEEYYSSPAAIKFLGQAALPTGFMFKDTEVGGLSALTYDRAKDIFYAVSDDKGFKQPARFYTLKIDLSSGRLNNGSVKLTDVTFCAMKMESHMNRELLILKG